METSKKYPEFAAKLRQLRANTNLRQEELAKKIGVGYKSYQSWEEGRARPKPPEAQIIANYFGIELADLYAGAAPIQVQTQTPNTMAGDIITIQNKLIAALERSERHAIEAKEAYKELAQAAKSTKRYVTKERFGLAEAKTDAAIDWGVRLLATQMNVPVKTLEAELDKETEERVRAYMLSISSFANTQGI